MSMGQCGESDEQRPRRSLKLGPKKAVAQARTRKLPLGARRTCQGTGSKICRPPARLLQDGNFQAQLATEDNVLRGLALTELPSTPPASRNMEELIVPDSPEESWSDKESSPRPCKLSRIRPSSTDFEEWVVPESPEETWATKALGTPLASNLEELIVPESPEESKDPSHRPWKLRRTGIRKVRLESLEDGKLADLERGTSELSPSRIGKRSGKLRFKSPAISLNSNRSRNCDVRLPVVAAEKTSSTISEQPRQIDSNGYVEWEPQLKHAAGESIIRRVTDADSLLPAFLPRRRTTATEKPLGEPAEGTNEAQMLLEDEDLRNCSKSRGSDYHKKYKEFHGGSPISYVPDTEDPFEDPAPVTPFATISGVLGASSITLEKPKAILGDESAKDAEIHAKSGARFQRNLHRDVQIPVSSSKATPAPKTPFPSAGGKPLLASSRPWKMEKVLREENLDCSENFAELAGAGHLTNGNESAVPTSCFVTGSGKPLWVSSVALEQARLLIGAEVEGAEFPGAGYQAVCGNGQTGKISKAEDAAPLKSSSMAKGNTLSDVHTKTSATSTFKVLGKTLSSSRDAQTPTIAAVGGAVPRTSFVTGSGKPVSVSPTALNKARALLEDESKCSERHGQFGGAGFQGSLPLTTSKFSHTPFPVPRKSSSMTMTKTLSDDHTPPFNEFDGAGLITSFVTGSGKPVSVSSGALKKARVLLGGELDDSESCAELDKAQYLGNVNEDFQSSKFPNLEDVPLINSSMANRKALSSPRHVTSSVINNAVPISSFMTGSRKSLSVSLKSLEKCTALFGDECEETETGVEFPGPTDQRSFCNIGPNPPIQNAAEPAPIGNFKSATEMPMSISTMPGNYVVGQVDTRIAVGATSTGFCTGSGKSIFVSSSAMEKARMLFCDKDEEIYDSATIPTNPGLGTQTTTFKDIFSTEGGIPESALPLPLKKANVLPKVRRKDDSNSGRFTLGAFSTASGNHISVSSLAVKKARRLLRDDYMEDDDCLTLPRATDDGNQLQQRTNERRAVENPTFYVPSLPLAQPGFTSSNTLAASASTRGSEEGKTSLGDDDKENHPEFEWNPNFECRQALRNSEFATDRTRKLQPLSEIQPVVPNSYSADGENCKIGGSYASHRVQRKENLQESPSRNRSRKTISIPSEAIQAAEARMAFTKRKGNDSEPAEKTADFEVKLSFMTGSGRTVTISNGAIEKATALLADGLKKASLREGADHEGTLVPCPTPSFRTSSGRTVFISSEAMSKAKVLLSPHDGELDVAGSSPEEINASRDDNVNADGTASGRGPCAAVSPYPSNLNRTAKFEQPTAIISKSHQLMDLSSKPSTPGVDYHRRNVSAFKRPRMWNQPDDAGTSKGVCGVNSCANQPQSLNPFTATRGHQQLQPSRPKYLLERVGSSMSGPIKLRDYIREILASNSEALPTSTQVRPITSDAAENYRILHVTGGRQETISNTEIWKLLLGLGADTRYANEEWVANHYKWIIWKRASLERKHPRQDARKLVTLDTVLQELKYRYDRELSGHRSAIRSITEGDSSASRTMVLCISAIRHYGDNETVDERTGKIASSGAGKIEVTDGWYRLNAVLDAPFTQLLQRGKLNVDQKIQVCGATLCCCSQPKPPLEAFQDSFLALHMNGTRRARRNARLGFCRGPFHPLAFTGIKPGGGLVPKTYVGVTRVYPILFRELSAAGIYTVRSARAEELASNQFEQRRANLVEDSILQLETSSNASISQKEKYEGYELFEAVERAAEPDILMADMTPTELKAFAVYQAKREVSRQAALEKDMKEALQQAGLYSRNVVRLLKVRVTGLNRREDRDEQLGRQTKEGTITILDVSDELEIAEGSVYCVSGLRPGTWGAKSSSNEDRLHLQAYPSASWRHVPEAAYNKHFSFPYICRAPTRLSEMDEKSVFREFDVAAAVLRIDEPFSCGSRTKQWVFVSDGSTSKNSPGDSWDEIQILAVRVSLPSPAFAPVDPFLNGSVVGCCNLIQQPKDYNTHFLVAEASELSLISSNLTSRPVHHLQAAADSVAEWVKSSRWAMDSLRNLVQSLTFQDTHSTLPTAHV